MLALDDRAAAELPAEVTLIRAPEEGSALDAIVGYAPPDDLPHWLAHLRPGGRLILAHPASADELLNALTAAGFIHCLVEAHADVMLYRGQRPPEGTSFERLPSSAQRPEATPFIFLLVQQTPNKPAWKLAPDETVEWHAATVIDPQTGEPVLLGFSSLVKAVAFMQPAVLAGFLSGINKVAKFRAEAAQRWTVPVRLNPSFEDWRRAALGPPYRVEPQSAIGDDEA